VGEAGRDQRPGVRVRGRQGGRERLQGEARAQLAGPLSPRVRLSGLIGLAAAALISLAAATGGEAARSGTSDTTAGLKKAKWGANVSVTYSGGYAHYRSNGLPNHARQAEYALQGPGGSYAAPDFTVAQNIDVKIPTKPTRAAAPTSAGQGTIGVMISGATLFNPYEGDGKTVATGSNFSVKDAQGLDVAFLDACNGHPTPMGAYHYHALPPCVTAKVDKAGGPSHIIGLAFDGYPIYGDRDIRGKKVRASRLDACNGITTATPEYPKGIYHYVLLNVPNSTSSIRCFRGKVDASLTQMGNGGPPPGAPPPPTA
jgi:hypothetical protein